MELSRFWRNVKRGPDCWEWTLSKTWNGYGRFSLTPAKGVRAHRFAWEMTNGPIPDGMCVCHKCDNPLCVRPDHLFLGTHKDNARDRERKGRGGDLKGENGPVAKLKNEQVAHIRWARKELKLSQYKLAAMFRVSQQQISRIVRGENW